MGYGTGRKGEGVSFTGNVMNKECFSLWAKAEAGAGNF